MKRPPNSHAVSGQKGVAAIEMAVMLPLLILIFTGLVEYGRLMWHYDALAKATRDAARFLADEPLDSNNKIPVSSISDARNMVGNAATAAGVEGLVTADDVDVTCVPAGCVTPHTVTVSVSYPFAIGGWVPVFGMANINTTLSPHTTMRYMR